jgi:hypothetical protein
MTFSDLFGFLSYLETLEFDGGRIEPVLDFQEGLRFIEKFENLDGYIYPPTIKSVELDLATMDHVRNIRKSDKPANLFSLPASHSLKIANSLSGDKLRYGDSGLLVHLLAFFFGTRLQFSDWRFDRKVPTKRMNSFCMHLTYHAVLSPMHISIGGSCPMNMQANLIASQVN